MDDQPVGPGPATGDKRLLSRRIQIRIMAVGNVPMRLLLGLPFRTPLSSGLMLLYYTGRKSGKAYRQPLSYVRHKGALLTPGGDTWKLNLKEGQPARLPVGGREVSARPEFVRDTEEIEADPGHDGPEPQRGHVPALPQGSGRQVRPRQDRSCRNLWFLHSPLAPDGCE